MGISGRPKNFSTWIGLGTTRSRVIKRFSGGGTVIVDESTLFISFLFAKDTLNVAPFPEPLLRWSADLYSQSWQIPDFISEKTS